MPTIGNYSAEGLRRLFTTQREELLTHARAGVDVHAEVKALYATIVDEFHLDDGIARNLDAEFALMRAENMSISPRSREAFNQAYGEATADFRLKTTFPAFAATINILRDGPGDGSLSGQKALFELAQNRDVVGISISNGYLEVQVKEPAAKSGVNAWFDQNCADLETGYRIRGMVTSDPK